MDSLFKLILLLASVALGWSEEPIVWIQNGKLLGRDNGRFLSFESIPYAEPPIGANRFEPPKPYTQIWSGVRDATYPPENCIQWATIFPGANKVMGIEDCLTVNVYTPNIEYTDEYPVLVLLHAGVFTFGGSSWHNHDYVMKAGNAVVVKVNYRLGALGFLSTEDDVIPGNFGLKDQLLAMEWVKTNIAAFNGNPLNITIVGFGSGGASVHLQMMNKRLEKLASTAISFSGNAFNPSVITRNPRAKAVELAKYFNCSTDNSTQIKSCLQQQDAAEMARSITHFFKFGFNPFVVFGPVIEPKDVQNPFLTEELEEIIKAGKSAEIPWLASCDKDEGAFNAAELMQKYSGDVEIIEDLNKRWNELAPVIFFFNNTIESDKFESHANELRKKYMGDKPFTAANYRLLQKMYTDVLFLNGIDKALKLHKQYTHSPVYSYGYDNPSPTGFGQLLSQRDDIDFGTAHGDDFFLMFRSPPRRNALLSLSDHILSQKFIKMIVDFSLTGNLQFGTCKITPNNSTTNNLWIAHITKDYCEMVNVETIL